MTPDFSPTALDILKDRYLWKDAEGNIIETPEDMLHRVAKHVASYESPCDQKHWEEKFYDVMAALDFLPNSPTLMNAGRTAPHGQLAACFVVEVKDSMEGICDALRQQMLIHKTGGGTGFNFSSLRPKNSTVNSTNGRASGPVSFMRLFDLSTDVVQQGGMRRGANMAILNADHPDIREFLHCKDKDGTIANFNLSVGVTEAFMRKAVSEPLSNEGQLLDEIAEQAWKTGDPGLVFLDAINRDNPTPQLGHIRATNPCGESPLLPGESCNLGSINLSHMLDANNEIDWVKLRDTVDIAVRFLDNVISVGQYPLPSIEEAVKRTRKIGLGIMGWADMLYKLRIQYGSPESISLAGKVMFEIVKTAVNQSQWLGYINGIPGACQHLKRRNATLTCIAPTGTLALLANCSSGIEPVFSLKHTRKITTVAGGTHEVEMLNPVYEDMLRDLSITDEEIKRVCVTAYDIPWLKQIAMQAAFQQYTHLAVSKTVNLLNDTPVGEIKMAFIYAWRAGCKGTTVYRDGSKYGQVLVAGDHELPEIKCTTC